MTLGMILTLYSHTQVLNKVILLEDLGREEDLHEEVDHAEEDLPLINILQILGHHSNPSQHLLTPKDQNTPTKKKSLSKALQFPLT